MKTISCGDEVLYRLKDNPNYFITKTGKVFSIYIKGGCGKVDMEHPRELCYGSDKDGYLRVVLSNNDKKRYVKVHTLVVEQFIGIIPEGYVVNHIDGNKQNNHVDNLEIVTVKENTTHAHKHGLCKRDTKVQVVHNGRTFLFSSKSECHKKFPDLSEYYLKQLHRGIVSFRAILFVKNKDKTISAIFNGSEICRFKTMREADKYYGKSNGTVFSTFKCNEYRTKVNKYQVTFPNVSTIERLQNVEPSRVHEQ